MEFYFPNNIMAQSHHQSFILSISQRGAEKLIEGGYIYGKHRRIGETTHWLCVQRGLCKAIVHTQGFEIVKRTNKPYILLMRKLLAAVK